MNSRERLEGYLNGLRRRIRAQIYARAAAVGALSALALTALLVWLLQRDGFGSQLVIVSRASLLLLLAFVAIALIVWPLRRLGVRQGAPEFERRLPAQHGRIETYLDAQRREASGSHSPLIDLLAGDAVALTDTTPLRAVVPGWRIWGVAAMAFAAVAVLALMLIAGTGFWGYGSRYLLTGAALPRIAVPLRTISVSPGDVTVRRNSDLTIRADIEGFTPDQAEVFVRFADEQRWQRAPMQIVENGATTTWEFKLYALRGPLHYYVAATNGRSTERSGEHNVAIVDLPRVERVRLTYEYPQWTGLPAQIEEESRDIRAVAGTQVKLEVFANSPLESPSIVVDGAAATMLQNGVASTGTIAVAKPGRYHISARVADELVALTDDYPIEIVSDEKPSIDIQKPGRDWRATSIEEVPVKIQAQDDFRLQQVELRYSVNGGDWQALKVAGGARQSNSESLLRLEDLGAAQKKTDAANESARLEPGDLVSYYAVAKDRKQAVQTDLFMVQVQPFERRFTQGQGGGGAGAGMGDEQGAISERQREILLATWNLQRSDEKSSRTRTQLQDNAKMLAELQATLAAQARTLAERMRARASTEEDPRIGQFVESLERAAKAMDPAAKYLNEFELEAAVPVEQQALQQLLRAESAFRDIQVAMQRDNGSGGGQQAARNFAEMFELEMDVDKNHYETQSQLSQRNERDELDEVIRKLKQLADRQEKLARQADRSAVSQREQRWQQEQLRREAEDLQRRLAELARSQNADSQSGQDSQRGSERSNSQQSRSTQNRSTQDRSEQSRSEQSRSEQARSEQGQSSGNQISPALNSMRAALEDMREANGDDSRTSRSAAEASRNLRQALEQMQRPRGEGMAETLEQLAEQAGGLAAEQRRVETDLYKALSEAMQSAEQRGQLDSSRAQQLIESKQRMANDVRGLQREMRDAMDDHRSDNPEATQRLGEALTEIETANLDLRLNRSIAEIRYGRAREAAPREGLIAEALDTLERNLRATAWIAAGEKRDKADGASPDALLAELGGLRQALQQAQDAKAPDREQPNSGQRSGNNEGGPVNGDTADNLSAWNPASPRGAPDVSSASLETGAGQWRRREAAEIAERLEAMANRLNGVQLTAAEINALRRMTRDLRRLAGNPLASQADAMAKLVDQIELAALAAARKSGSTTSAHTAASTADTPQYREAVAEYYRRLGSGCTHEEGARPC